MALLMGVIEFGFLYNNLLTVQFAARQGASAAAQAGGVDGADCSILDAVEKALTPPVDHRARGVRRDLPVGRHGRRWCRGPSTATCERAPSTARARAPSPTPSSAAEGYPQIERHDALVEGLDVIGVRIGYQYVGMTPVAFGRTWDLADGATLRMEPKQ